MGAKKIDVNHIKHLIPAWAIQGIIFGYPPCCVGEFVVQVVQGTTAKRGKRKLSGTGYVPCELCNKKKAKKN